MVSNTETSCQLFDLQKEPIYHERSGTELNHERVCNTWCWQYIVCYFSTKTTKLFQIESFRWPFTLNSNGEKRHKVSCDTLNWQCLRWIFNVYYFQNHLLLYEILLSSFACQRISFNVLWVYMLNSISWVSVSGV